MRILVILLVAICCLQQNATNDEFDALISMFEKGRARIDSHIASKYLGFEENEDRRAIYTNEMFFMNDSLVCFSCYLPCAAGGLCESVSLYLFVRVGKQLKSARRFEYEYRDCGSHSYKQIIYRKDSLLLFAVANKKMDCSGDSILSQDIKIESYFLSPKHFLKKLGTQYINTDRDYFVASSQFLRKEDLESYSHQELAAIRNEIYAAHGYRFKTKFWQDYFDKMEWHDPLFDNVDQFLSVIEKQNIQSIKKLENKK